MTSQMMTPDLLRGYLNDAKDMIAADKLDLLTVYPLPPAFNREEYGFAYIRAERFGMRVIDRKLASLQGLPLQLDARAEVMDAQRGAMKRWLKTGGTAMPAAEDFGNDFIHALARAGLLHGWDTGVTQKLAARIGNLFRDLSCLIALLYYCSWLADHGVARFPLTVDDDLPRMALAAGTVVQAAEIARQVQAEDQAQRRAKRALAKPVAAATANKKLPPVLQLIANPAFAPPPAPEILPV